MTVSVYVREGGGLRLCICISMSLSAFVSVCVWLFCDLEETVYCNDGDDDDENIWC